MFWLGLALLCVSFADDTAPEQHAAATVRLRAMLGDGAVVPLTLAEVLDAVDARNPRLGGAQVGIDRARGTLRSARGFLDPEVRFGGRSLLQGYYGYSVADAHLVWDTGAVQMYGGWRYGRDGSPLRGGAGTIPSYYGQLYTLDGGEWRVGAEASVLQGLVTDPRRAGVQVARADLDRAEATAGAVDVDLRQQGTGAWVSWVARGRALALERALLDIAQLRQRAVEARVGLGELAAIEELRNQQFLAQRRADYESAVGAFQAATEGLSLFLRDPDGARIRVGVDRLPARTTALPVPLSRDEDDLVAYALARHPQLQAMVAVVEQRRAILRLERNRRLPDLSVFGEASQDTLLDPQNANERYEGLHVLAGVRGRMPTLNRTAGGAAAAADAALRVAELELQWASEQLEAAVRQAVARERAALEGLRAAIEAVELALLIQTSEQRRFDLGEIDLLRLWLIEQETASTIRSEIGAWAHYEVARAALIASVGGALPD